MKEGSNHSLSCLVVDDEPKAQKALSRLISQMSWLRLLGCSNDVPAALEIIVEKRPDVIFLDIEMPGLTGLDLLKSLPAPRPLIVLVSAYREYALDGFEFEVTDFLLKPVSPERFLKTALKLSVNSQNSLAPPVVLPIRQDKNQSGSGYEWVKADGRLHRIAHRDIYAVRALKDYVKIYHSEGMLVVRASISGMADSLPEADFVRIHRSCIINRHKVKMIDGNTVKLTDGSEYVIADRMKRDVILKQLINP